MQVDKEQVVKDANIGLGRCAHTARIGLGQDREDRGNPCPRPQSTQASAPNISYHLKIDIENEYKI
jgi:hypothetical protein